MTPEFSALFTQFINEVSTKSAELAVTAGSSFITTQTQLEEASQSAQIKAVCDRDYKNTSYKDVPIKCLEFWGFTKK